MRLTRGKIGTLGLTDGEVAAPDEVARGTVKETDDAQVVMTTGTAIGMAATGAAPGDTTLVVDHHLDPAVAQARHVRDVVGILVLAVAPVRVPGTGGRQSPFLAPLADLSMRRMKKPSSLGNRVDANVESTSGTYLTTRSTGI